MSASSSKRVGTSQPFTLPILFQDLRQSEALFQIFDALENLDLVIEGVFSKVSGRVNEQKNKLQTIGNRLLVAQAKINHISGTKKATTVHSPSKYPEISNLLSYEPIFASVETQTVKRSSYKYQDSKFPLISYEKDNRDLLLSETSLTFENDNRKEGLGRLPEYLPSVSTLLLFNAQENPYKKYISIDNLVGRDVQKKEDPNAKKNLTEAPKTFTEGDNLPSVGGIEYSYKPVLGEVPEFNLPSALPLPNVADISWSGNPSELHPIAPSFLSTDLPSVESSSTPQVTSIPSISVSSSSLPSVSSSSLPSVSAPPPSSLPSVSASPQPPPSVSGPSQPSPSVSAPPPPPPPPPPSAPPPLPSFESSSDFTPPPSSGDRSSLLAQIREGTKLKSAKDRTISEKPSKKSKAPSSASSGDIFSDLRKALDRRRVGIADKQQERSKNNNDEEDLGTLPDEWK